MAEIGYLLLHEKLLQVATPFLLVFLSVTQDGVFGTNKIFYKVLQNSSSVLILKRSLFCLAS